MNGSIALRKNKFKIKTLKRNLKWLLNNNNNKKKT